MAGKPSFLNYLPPLSKETAMLEHAGYRDRVRGVQATDEMIVRHSHRGSSWLAILRLMVV